MRSKEEVCAKQAVREGGTLCGSQEWNGVPALKKGEFNRGAAADKESGVAAKTQMVVMEHRYRIAMKKRKGRSG